MIDADTHPAFVAMEIVHAVRNGLAARGGPDHEVVDPHALGRRIPYLLFTLPVLCLFLTILGFSDHIGAWVKGSNSFHSSRLCRIASVT